MLIIDRFEGEYAVIEYNRRTFDLPRALLPKEAKVGDVISLSIVVDEDAKRKRKKDIDSLVNELFD